MKKEVINKIINIVVILLIPIFCISFSAFIPCFFKSFYYMWIKPLHIPETSGYSIEVIKEAYSDVFNFIWRGAEFKTGELAYTEVEKSHFQDCVPLFWLQLILMLVSGLLLLTYFILVKTKVLNVVKFKNIPVYSYGGIGTCGLLVLVGLGALINFDGMFVLFHKIFFPGKENWLFDETTEEIIKILPESFFIVCAVFIISLIIILSLVFILIGIIPLIKSKKEKNS